MIGAVLPSLRREEEEHTVMLGSLGALYTSGYVVDWSRIYPAARCVRLPMYPWQRERCWLEGAAAESDSHRGQVRMNGTGKHPLLGRHFKSPHPAETHFWEVNLDKDALPYLDDHRIEGVAVLPGAVYLEMALAAAAEGFASHSFVLKDFEFRKALFLPDGKTHTIQVVLSPDANATASIYIYSRPGDVEQQNGSWTLHATGKLCPEEDGIICRSVEQEVPTEIRARCSEPVLCTGLLS